MTEEIVTEVKKLTKEEKWEARIVDIVFLAKVAEQAEHFEDLRELLLELINLKLELNKDFTREERNLVGVGFRNYVGVLQASIRVVGAINKTKKYKKYGKDLPLFKLKLQMKLKGQIL